MAKNQSSTESVSGWLVGLGILFMLFGFIMMIFPVMTTVSLELFFGVLLFLGGIVQIILSFVHKGWKGFLLTLLSGILFIIVGLIMLFNPLGTLITLTLLIATLLLIGGLIKIIFSLVTKSLQNRGWVLFNGVISLLLGWLILIGWPADAIWLIGLFFGIDMLFGGITMIMLSSVVDK